MPNERKDQRRGPQRGESSDDKDLARREYRDSQGNIHHHTHQYMKDHKGKKQ
jgi:hypothetical protein